MTDYRGMYDRDYVGAWDLGGRDIVVTIRKVEAGTLVAAGGRKNKKPIVWFEGREKALALNRTNGKTIAGMYGNDTRAWVGKQITIYPTTTEMAGETVDCIRVRAQPPASDRPRGRNGSRSAEPEPPRGDDEQPPLPEQPE